jgi:hypothetical protein
VRVWDPLCASSSGKAGFWGGIEGNILFFDFGGCALPENQYKSVGHSQPNVLEYARPTTSVASGWAGWIFFWISTTCPALFFLYLTEAFGKNGMVLLAFLGAGLPASLVGVILLRGHRKGLALSIVGLCLNLICFAIVVYLIYTD